MKSKYYNKKISRSSAVSNSALKLLLISIFALCWLTVFPVAPAYAAPGLTVEGALLVTEVSPGDILKHKIIVSIASSDSPQDILARVADVEQNLDGSYKLFEVPAENNSFSAFSYITLDKNSAHLEPGAKQELIATIRIPQNAGDGGRYAIINIQTKPVGQGGLGISSAVNVPVYLTIKNTKIRYSGEISAISTGEITSGKPVDILLTFHNQGNIHYKIKSEVTVTDASGKKLDTILVPAGSSIIPNMNRQIKASFIPENPLSPGTFNIAARVTLEDGTPLDESQSNFEVRESYIPPARSAAQIPSESSPTSPPGTNWLLIGVIGGFVVLDLTAATLIIRHRRRKSQVK
jgi:hypothetical protein